MNEPKPKGNTMQGDQASIFTVQQEAQLRMMKRMAPYRIVWGAVNAATGEFEAYASYDRRQLNQYLRNGWLVATIG